MSDRRPARERGGETTRPTSRDDLFAPTPDLGAQYRADVAEWKEQSRAGRENELERRIGQLERPQRGRPPSAFMQSIMAGIAEMPKWHSRKEAEEKLEAEGVLGGRELTFSTWNRAKKNLGFI